MWKVLVGPLSAGVRCWDGARVLLPLWPCSGAGADALGSPAPRAGGCGRAQRAYGPRNASSFLSLTGIIQWPGELDF